MPRSPGYVPRCLCCSGKPRSVRMPLLSLVLGWLTAGPSKLAVSLVVKQVMCIAAECISQTCSQGKTMQLRLFLAKVFKIHLVSCALRIGALARFLLTHLSPLLVSFCYADSQSINTARKQHTYLCHPVEDEVGICPRS